MSRTETSVGLLKAIATIVGFAIILWSLGLPSLRFATAATVSSFSDTVTDSAPNADANHTISFVAPSGVAAGQEITITFPAGFDLSAITEDDIDLEIDGDDELTDTSASGATWGVDITDQTITIVSDTATIGSASTTVIKIGTHAEDSGAGANQISNPPSEGSYEIELTSGDGADVGTTHVVVLSTVLVEASVDTVFTFAVSGVAAGVAISPTETTTGETSSTSIPFGVLEAGALQATTSAQQLTVTTNASQGYQVTVQTDGPLESTTGGIIDGFSNESDTAIAWTSPDGNVNDPTTWGHWGVTSNDATTTRSSQFGSDESTFVAPSTNPRVVMSHNGPANGAGTGIGTAYVGYKVEITALQEAGDDYSTNLTYIATPTF
jgi:hypothetical protein